VDCSRFRRISPSLFVYHFNPAKPIGGSHLDNDVSYGLPLVMAYGNALAVLADPTRRKVFERLRAGPRPVNLLAAGLPVSRPAVSQHLKALKDAGLVEERSEGVRRIYSLRREGLVELRQWLDSFWVDALEAFKLEAERSHKSKRSK
jgi:DNA-binding transcriptional ArsR family regulator